MAFGIDIKGLTAKLDERFQQLIAEIRTLGDKLDSILDELRRKETGAITFGPIVGVIIIALALVGLFAICGDEENGEIDGLGRVELVSHEYDEEPRCYGGDCYDQSYDSEDRNRNRNRNRGAFSPGPFDDSPVDAFNNVCMPGATCHYDGRGEPPPEEGEPA